MEEVIYLNELYDLYGDLLTEKQKQYFEDYYFDNLSFSEIAENYGISRNALFKQIHITTDKLKEYETKLNLWKKNKKLEEIILKIENDNIKKELEELL